MNGASHAGPAAAPVTPPVSSPVTPPVTVTRIGTQVVVRLSGRLDRQQAGRLAAAADEVATLALRRVVVDLEDVDALGDAGLDFLDALRDRWSVRLLNAPAGLRRAAVGAARPA